MKSADAILLILITASFSQGFDKGSEAVKKPFPAGYIDSPYVVPDGSALYFIHSVASTFDLLTGNPYPDKVADYLPGHQGQDGAYWWNTDVYVSYRKPDGTWGMPQNAGPAVNTEHMECCPWVNDGETLLVFTRESVTDSSLSGSFFSTREARGDPWSEPELLPGELGEYDETGFHDFHPARSGNLYFWSGLTGDGVLLWSRWLAPGVWDDAEVLPDVLQSGEDETQPWVNDGETVLAFNRRGEDGNTELLVTTRADTAAEWGVPTTVLTLGFADPGGNTVWGEPSFTDNATMYLVRFDTSSEEWDAELLMAPENGDGSYGPPIPLVFNFWITGAPDE